MTEDKYCIDTSALIHAWVRAYPIHNFKPIWDHIDGLIRDGRLYSFVDVRIELEKRNDALYEWAKDREKIFLDIEDEELQIRIQEILTKYPRLVDTRKNRSGADPFVIAVASLYNPPLVVVTEEKTTTKIEKPNIPDICAAEDLDCITILEMITREGWRL